MKNPARCIHAVSPPDAPLSRRTFLTGAALGGVGVLAGIGRREAVATRLAGRSPSEVQGVGVPPGVVRLAFNENPLGASPMAIEAVLRHKDWMNRYDYSPALLKALVRHHRLDIRRVSGFDFKAVGERHGIIIGVGTTEILQLLALAALMPDGEVIEAMPAYGQITRVGNELREAGYPVLARRVPLRSDGTHDLEGMRQAVTDRTRLIIICNPHNPTGTLLPHDEILGFIDRVPPRVMIAIDEVYIQFVRDPMYPDFLETAKERENVIVLRTFSKAHGLGGVRVGYGVGHKNIIKRLAPFSMGLLGRNVLSVFAALAALKDTEHIRRSRRAVWDGNDYLTGALQEMGFSVFPSHANFLMVDCGRETRKLVQRLWAEKVMVRTGAGQWDMPNHIRVSTGTMEENKAFIQALRKALG